MAQPYITQSKLSEKISINPDFCDDPFYRYKMHQIIIETTKGKTFLINIDDVASELKVDHMYIIRYFGSVLGTQSNYDKKSHKAYLSGIFNINTLSECMIQFIQEIVLCKQCGLPELDYICGKNKTILLCRSCGSSDNLNDRNIPDALQKYITSHPYK